MTEYVIARAAGLVGCIAVLGIAAVAGQDAGADTRELRYRMVVAEDSRPATRTDAAPLLDGLDHPSAEVVREAVRALGRLEHIAFLPDVERALFHSAAPVRAEAAYALARLAPGNPDRVLLVLRNQLAIERTATVRAALCAALGRVPFAEPATRTSIEQLLVRTLSEHHDSGVVRGGAVRGLEALIRRGRGTAYVPQVDTCRVLRSMVLDGVRPDQDAEGMATRRVAVLALNAAGGIDDRYEPLVHDPDDQVRRAAIAGLMVGGTDSLRTRLLAMAQADTAPGVRYEALRVYARHQTGAGCGPVVSALRDRNEHIVLLAIDTLASACPGDADVTQALTTLAEDVRPDSWRRRAHAVVAVATRRPEGLSTLLESASSDVRWLVRMYAAHAATLARDAQVLWRLEADSHPRVRAAAIDGLIRVLGHDADGRIREALASPRVPVVMAATRALAGTPDPSGAMPPLLAALGRLSDPHRDSSRDVRLLLLDRIDECGSAASVDALMPRLADPDPIVAQRAADVIGRWRGRPQPVIRITDVPRIVPRPADLARLPYGARISLKGGATIDLRFFSDEAPVMVWRVARLVAAGYYDGLTFHRVVPNFVVQGGSPDADEYVGDGPFIRDTFSARSHRRGTIGMSTRGRDTGDAQFFINLIDNPRLDHDYSVFAEVTAGMESVDHILEGTEIAHVALIDHIGRGR